jgi:phosphonate transport system substrate-binding protein
MKKFQIALTLVALAMLIALAPMGARTNAQGAATAAPTMAATASAVDKTGWPETFIIGVYPGDNIEKAIKANEPLRAYLEGKLGVRTVVITGTSYNAVIEAMRAGRADAFEVGPFSYVLAAQVASAEAIAVSNYTTKVDLDKLPGYYSVLITKKGSGIKSIADLKGKTVSFADPASTSGYLVPFVEIMNAQKFDAKDQLDTFFGKAIFAGNHPASVQAVNTGKVDAGATFDDNLTDQVKAGIPICGVTADKNPFTTYLKPEEIQKIYDACPDGQVAVFYQSSLIPQTPFAISSKFPASFKTAVKAALLDLAKDQKTVDALGRFYVDPTTINKDLKSIDALYDPLRVIAKKLNLDLTKK